MSHSIQYDSNAARFEALPNAISKPKPSAQLCSQPSNAPVQAKTTRKFPGLKLIQSKLTSHELLPIRRIHVPVRNQSCFSSSAFKSSNFCMLCRPRCTTVLCLVWAGTWHWLRCEDLKDQKQPHLEYPGSKLVPIDSCETHSLRWGWSPLTTCFSHASHMVLMCECFWIRLLALQYPSVVDLSRMRGSQVSIRSQLSCFLWYLYLCIPWLAVMVVAFCCALVLRLSSSQKLEEWATVDVWMDSLRTWKPCGKHQRHLPWKVMKVSVLWHFQSWWLFRIERTSGDYTTSATWALILYSPPSSPKLCHCEKKGCQ